MKLDFKNLKNVTILEKKEQKLISGGNEPSWHYNCYPTYSLDSNLMDDCYWEFYE
ncbi:hypothetical protein [Aquimarina sp. 2201CG5-10]|uniref:hypothetical protein n=1 Tax=Aquimarina callyspongiae TaxID=3098150 RepID=UPI002AB361A7|nr:hypothetical protein [Aquimarina sp. 2201CG5-10]MDY8136825.1 hypothetical protein [Aquimarina sp. 2201CG5-10]